MKTEEGLTPDGNKVLLLAATTLALKIMALSVPMATVRLSANRKATKPMPDMMNTTMIVTSKPGQ